MDHTLVLFNKKWISKKVL